ncbi:hypothetical protein CFIICLFH_4814 [Methylobacterium goesingense]|nr:hypothetical protein CFIICLFH_4814 [Methylobacterium goesingense]
MLWKATRVPSAEIEAPVLPPPAAACAPVLSVETRVMAPVLRSLTKTSVAPFVSPVTRLVARLWKATRVPSAEIEGARLPPPVLCAPVLSVETRVVVPVPRSLTKMSCRPLVSPVTRLLEVLTKATRVPSAEIEAAVLGPRPCAPALSVETRVVVPVPRSLTKTSVVPLVSPSTRLLAVLWKATRVPSAEIAAMALALLASAPVLSVETRVVVPVRRSLRKMS